MRHSILFLSTIIIIASVTQGQAQKRTAEDFYYEGEQALDQNKYNLALAKYNECLRLDPYYMEAYRSRASAREGLGDIRGALTDYSIYIESKPSRSDALFGRGVLRYRLGQYLGAKEDFQLVLRLPPGPTNTIVFRQEAGGTDKIFTMESGNTAEVLNYLALVETKLKNYGIAMTYIDSAIHLAPKEPHFLVNRGIIKEHAIDTAGAIADYERALALDPSEGSASHNLAVIKRSRGQQNESEKLLTAAINQSPGLPYPYAARAYYRFRNKDSKGAIEDYNKALALNPTDEESWLYRGIVKERLKDYDGAFIDYTQAITLKNDYVRAWLTRGNLLVRQGRLEDAVEDYTVALTWYAEYGQAFFNRAIVYQKQNKLKEACSDLSQAEKFNCTVTADLKKSVCK